MADAVKGDRNADGQAKYRLKEGGAQDHGDDARRVRIAISLIR